MAAWTEKTIEIAGTKIHLTRGGKGPPVLVLHRDIGTLEASSFHDELAKSADVIVPHHPGWGRSPRAEWMRSVRDVAVMHRGLLAELGIEQASLVGLGFGGWIAAEMATMAPGDVARLVLVGPMGIKPPEGDIFDQAIVSYIDYARAGFHDQKAFDKIYGAAPSTDQLEAWDIAPRDVLPHRLEALHVQPDPAASAGEREGAGSHRLGRQGQDRALSRRRTATWRRCRTPSSRSSRTADIAWTWSSRRGSPGSSRPSSPADTPSRAHGRISMHLMYFTEQPMSAYDAKEGLKYGATALTFSNKHFDPVAGSRLYNEYLEQYIYAEEVGVDGIMLNEHHNAPFCMQAKANIFAAVLAGATKRVKIVMLGNPLPLAENPIRLAEELAMIDMISKGRLVSGFVRGGGQEQLATGVNPAYNRERFEEAHDLIVEDLDRARPVPLGGHALSAPRRQSVGGAAAEALSARVDPGRHQQGDDHLGSQAALSLYRAQHLDRADQEHLEALRRDRRRGRLQVRPGKPRLSGPHPRGGDRGEGDPERQAVHVDAGRVHRARASGVGQPVRLFLARAGGAVSSSSRWAGRRTRAATRHSRSSAPTA